MERLIDQFYLRVLEDAAPWQYRTGADVARIKRHQTALLTRVLDGPDRYDGQDLAVAHAGLDISDVDYWRVGDHLVSVLNNLGADAGVIDQVICTLVMACAQVVDHPGNDGRERGPVNHNSPPRWRQEETRAGRPDEGARPARAEVRSRS